MAKSSITKKFHEFQTGHLRSGEELISFPYDESKGFDLTKKEITETALIFWKFLRKNYSTINVKEKRNRLADFLYKDPLAQNNYLVRVVAMIESLPTTIWRKLLWRENIDFSSYESCLRRLSEDQIREIEGNYNDLFSYAKVSTPRVLKKSWRDRIKLFLGITSVKKILEEGYNDQARNQSKGAYAFSLLGLDFGFSLYPKGNNDDTKITNKKYSRFLSIKEHINDFIVNQEDGKYWWLYRTARSNYAINPGKKVKMKTHVCPGFWMTLILHSSFWIMSPIALLLTGLMLVKNGFTPAISITAIFASPMIIWTAILILRIIFKAISGISENNIILKSLAYIIPFCLLAAAICVSIVYLIPVCGLILAILFVPTFIFYVIFACVAVVNDYNYKDIPRLVRLLLHLIVGIFAVGVFVKFFAEMVIDFVITAMSGLWQWYISNLLLSNWLFLSFVFAGLFIWFIRVFLEDEKRFVSLRKVFAYLSWGFFILTSAVFLYLSLKVGFFGVAEFGLIPILFFVFVSLAFSYAVVMLGQINLGNIEERLLALNFLKTVNDGITGFSYKIYIANIIKSKWLNSLDAGEKWCMINRIQELALSFFWSYPRYRINFVSLLINKGSIGIIKILEDSVTEIKDFDGSRGDRLEIIEMVVSGLSVKKALETIEVERSKYSKFIRGVSKFFGIIIYPLVMIYDGMVWVFRKIGQFFGTLEDLWGLFNKRCPFVSQQKYLD